MNKYYNYGKELGVKLKGMENVEEVAPRLNTYIANKDKRFFSETMELYFYAKMSVPDDMVETLSLFMNNVNIHQTVNHLSLFIVGIYNNIIED